MTVTDASGSKSFDVLDGSPGTPGTPGTTPIKGVDYFTSSDKAALVSDVLAALPTWTGGSY